ncbi:isochorismate synthase [Dysgonomonas sp. Marseille-P4677]|uniref:isochorismate synthase n=1 Tax=Dysgonomonas sp. Marseille-P4677 TaxID=2364790 RepID=UPI0019134908|nr:isochorismate synthase [Dysgonomonas sp. Marseille-P4677]MBK5722782.1 isochorismate synthase [Dysgonomonas sp. Marseille-P4677]
MGLNQSFDYRIFDFLIDRNIHFALYRMPWQQDIHLILQFSQGKMQPKSFSDLNLEKGFVVAPFHISVDTPLVLIRPDVQLVGEDKIFEYLENEKIAQISDAENVGNQSSINSFEQYKSVYNTFYSALEENVFQKIVLSRTFDVDRESAFSAGVAFQKTCGKYAANFVFLCNSKESGTWMGVSPELLVAEEDDVCKTVALAGTRKLSTADWDNKNVKEQQIVVDYMQQQLNKLATDITQSGPFTVQAGEIEHLKTKFSFRLKGNSKIGNLLDMLHPSPAVCGFPKESAFEFILKNESYNRRYYSGFVGPLDIEGKSRLYVNLRCMQIGKDILRLYAGGGMLPSSELKSEWEETENKLQTILTVIR